MKTCIFVFLLIGFKSLGRNSTLATINTAEKFRILYPMDLVWIGLDDIATEGTYRWADGSILDLQSNLRYTIFQEGEPNAAFENEDCVCNRCYHDYDKLYDDNCGETYNYLCEKTFR